jgi:hypothetical protein
MRARPVPDPGLSRLQRVRAVPQKASAPQEASDAVQAGSRSYIPCTSEAWKRATWFVGGNGSL